MKVDISWRHKSERERSKEDLNKSESTDHYLRDTRHIILAV